MSIEGQPDFYNLPPRPTNQNSEVHPPEDFASIVEIDNESPLPEYAERRLLEDSIKEDVAAVREILGLPESSQDTAPEADSTTPEEENHAQRRNQLEKQEVEWTPPMYPGTMESLAYFRAELKETELPYQKSLAQIAGIMNVMQDKCKELLIAFQYAEEQGDKVNHAAVLWQLTDAAALMNTAYRIIYRAPQELKEEDAPQMSLEEYQKRMAEADLAKIKVPAPEPR